MAEETEVAAVESKATPEAQAAAEKLGWIPPARFKGEAERFVDADEYIKRGETVLPIVKEHNRRLQGELETLRTESAKTAAALKAAQLAIEQIEERHSVDTQKAVEAARKQLKAQLAAASEADDHEGVAELTDQLTQLNTAEKEAPPLKKKADEEPAAQQSAAQLTAVKEWWGEHADWYGVDRRKTSLALGIAQELREGGETAQGPKFFKMVLDEVEKTFKPAAEAPRVDRVEGGRNGSENESRSSAKKGYIHLPADAKAACDGDARKFVGEGKKYKTAAEWRQRYAEIYFESEA